MNKAMDTNGSHHANKMLASSVNSQLMGPVSKNGNSRWQEDIPKKKKEESQ